MEKHTTNPFIDNLCRQLRESRIKEALMRAYVAGWQDAHAGSLNDDRKREVAQDLLDWFLT